MALQNCHECGKQVSNEADKCPECGAPVKKPLLQKKIGCLGSILIILAAYLIIKSVGVMTSEPSKNVITSPQSTPTVSQVHDAEDQHKKAKQEEDKFLKTTAGKIWNKHRHWDKDICRTIADGSIRMGMTDEQVRLSWGKPYKINISSGSWGTHEQWVMHDSTNSDYLYFENGILTSLQRSK
jgi:hypothetical protein